MLEKKCRRGSGGVGKAAEKQEKLEQHRRASIGTTNRPNFWTGSTDLHSLSPSPSVSVSPSPSPSLSSSPSLSQLNSLLVVLADMEDAAVAAAAAATAALVVIVAAAAVIVSVAAVVVVIAVVVTSSRQVATLHCLALSNAIVIRSPAVLDLLFLFVDSTALCSLLHLPHRIELMPDVRNKTTTTTGTATTSIASNNNNGAGSSTNALNYIPRHA